MRGALARAAVLAAIAALPTAGAAQQLETSAGQVTFTRDVAPILQRSCVTCHRKGELAPMALTTYEEVRPWIRSIKTRVAAREMPPWHIDRNIGIQKFKDDPSLSEEEIATIVSWVDGGGPQGSPADMPRQRVFADAMQWGIGTPDLVVKYPAYTVPAVGPDLFGNLYADIDITESRYIKAVQTRPATPAARRVIHHALSHTIDRPDSSVTGDDSVALDSAQFLVEYAAGKNGEIYPGHSGVLLEAGKKAMVSYHLHSVGEKIKAEIELGMAFHPKGFVPKYVRQSKQLAKPSAELDIPGGMVSRVDGYAFLQKPAVITAFQPHMHSRGKRQCLELIYPTRGQSAYSEVVSCANFNYNWHLVYNYADDAAPLAPAGTVLHTITWHDNSSSNRSNPDPRNWVGDGQRTVDEMGFVWIGWYDLTDEEYKERLAARKALQGTAPTTPQQQP